MQPNLIHEVDIVIEQLNKTSTLYDDDAREPVQQVNYTSRQTVKGQPRRPSSKNSRIDLGGLNEGETGWVTFRYLDLDAKSIVLKGGDRFVSFGSELMDVYFTRSEPMGHYTDFNGPTLLKAYFSDRNPASTGKG